MHRKSLISISLIVYLLLVCLVGYSGSFASAKSCGHVSIAFDDGWQNQYDNAYPLLRDRGINATFYATSGLVNTPSYMTIEELQTLQAEGNEIGSHSVTHPWFPSLTDDQMHQECQESKEVLESWGLSVNNFAYPYGGLDSHCNDIVAQHYRSARSAYAEPYIMQFPPTESELTGYPGETDDSNALPQLQSIVDQVCASNGWTIIFFHNVVDDPSGMSFAISTVDFEAFLDYSICQNVEFLTVDQALDRGSSVPLTVTINPSSATLYLGQSQTFSATVSGCRWPFSCQWYFNNTALSGCKSWTFTPTMAGHGTLYFNLTDARNVTIESPVVHIQVNDKYPLLISTNYGTVSPSSGDYEVGSTVSISATSPVANVGERYLWQGWSGLGAGNYCGMDNPAQIAMDSSVSQTAQWLHQYLVTFEASGLDSSSCASIVMVNGVSYSFADLPCCLWVDSGSSMSYTYVSAISSTTAGKQFVLDNVNASSHLSVSESLTVHASYETQYYLTTTSPYGVLTGSGWYSEGSTAFVTLNSGTVLEDETRYVFTGWAGGASGETLGSDAIVMNMPRTAVANWKTQYFLNLSSTFGSVEGSGWYDEGATAIAVLGSGTVSCGNGLRSVFGGWVGDVSGNDFSTVKSIIMDSSKSVMTSWRPQVYLTFNQLGVSSEFFGNLLTINGTNYDRSGFGFWANKGDVFGFHFSSELSCMNGTRFSLVGVSGNTSSYTVMALAPSVVTGAYKTQYYFTSISNGLLSSSSGWYDAGSTITQLEPIPASNGQDIRRICVGWSGEGSLPVSGNVSVVKFTINEPSAITWNYKTQYRLSLHVNPSNAGITNPLGGYLWVDVGKIVVSVSPNSGYLFSYWSTDSQDILIENTTDVLLVATINGPGAITANLANTTAALLSVNLSPGDSNYSADPTPTTTQPATDPSSSPSAYPIPAVPELSTLVIVPLLLSLLFFAVVIRYRKIVSQSK